MIGYLPYGVPAYGIGGAFESVGPSADKHLKLYYRNILETASIINVTSEDSSYPKYRLYDRKIGLIFKGATAPAIFVIDVDQGEGSQYAIDTVIIGPGHNLEGLVLSVQHRSQSVDYFTQSVAWVAAAGAQIKKIDLTVDRYWRLAIYGPTSNPEITELWFTKSFPLEIRPIHGSDRGMEENISRIESKSGLIQKIIWGPEKRARRYDFIKVSEAQRLEIEIFRESIYGKNIWIEDLEEELFFAEILGGLGRFRYEAVGRWGFNVNVLEVLP